MIPYHQPVDEDHPLGAKAARDGIPALRAEAARISGAIAACSAAVRFYQIKIEAVLGALASEVEAMPDPACLTPIEIGLTPDDFDTAETVIKRLQEDDPNLSIDDCLNEIFSTGLAELKLVHHLISSPRKVTP